MTDTKRIRITHTAASELQFKTEVTRDDHGSPEDNDPQLRCNPCGENTPSGHCDRSRQAHEVAQQLMNGHCTKRHIVLTLTHDAIAYAAGEMNNAADIVEGNASDSYDRRERMGYLAQSRSYRAAEAAFIAAMTTD